MLQIDTDLFEQEQKPVLLDSGCRRSHTTTMRYQAVQRAILTMQERYMGPLTLSEIADAAQLSPFHFDRVFRSMIGVSPSVFIAAIRMKEAQKLLLETNRSVTSICFDVGYTSLGTFTSRFTQLVGLPPSRFRQVAQDQIMQIRPLDLQHLLPALCAHHAGSADQGISGSIHTTAPFAGLIFVGLFSHPLPQGQPVGCCILTTPGRYAIAPVPDGEYYLFSAAVSHTQNFYSVLHQGPSFHGGKDTVPLVVRQGCATVEKMIVLTRPSWADPPVVFAFPWLFLQQFQHLSHLALPEDEEVLAGQQRA